MLDSFVMADPFQPITKSRHAPPFKRWLWCGLLFALVVVLAWPSYLYFRSYRYEQLLEQAHEELKQGATPQANFHLRVLVANFGEDDRTYAALSKYASLLNRPEAAAWMEKAIQLNPEKTDYRVAHTLALLQFNQLAAAEKNLTQWPEAQRETVAYYQAQAAVAFTRGHWEQAAPFLKKIVALEGPTPLHQNNLAKAQLHSDIPTVVEQARLTLEEQLKDDRLAWQAGQALLQDALRRENTGQAQGWMARLRTLPRTSVNQDLLLLEVGTQLGAHADEQRAADLASALERWQQTPDAAARLIGWMAANGLSDEAIHWSQSLDPLLQEEYPVAFAVGEARLKLKRIGDVFSSYEGKPWSRYDEQRHLLLARASALQTPEQTASENLHLQRAIEIAAREEFGLLNLERILQTWRWSAALEPVWWRLLEKRQQVPRALLSLYQWYEHQKDYSKMLQLAEFELGLDPNNVAAANNYAYLSLLLGRNRERAIQLAQDVYARHPDQPNLAATYALALYEEGKFEAAWKALQTLSTDQRRKASNQLLYARILAGRNDMREARNALQPVDKMELIPPELSHYQALEKKLTTLPSREKAR